MVVEFRLPELGENITSADITKVLVKVGDKIKKEQPLAELETDKASMEIPSDIEGVVKEVKMKEGEKASAGQVLLLIETESSESVPALSVKTDSDAAEIPQEIKPALSANNDKVSKLYNFKLPELGENISKASVTKILVKEGDFVKKDQALVELETDKASMEVPSDVNGIVKQIKISEGSTANVGEIIFIIETSDSDSAENKTDSAKKIDSPQKPVPEAPALPKTEPVKKEAANEAALETKSIIAPAAPSVRRFAREIGIKINNVRGSGPGGRISIEDVKKYAKSLNENIESASSGGGFGIKTEPLPDFSKWGETDIQPMNNVRKKTAEHLSYAWASIPHVTQFDKADITELEEIRKQYGKLAESAGGKLTVTAILLKIAASALKKFPQFNASVNMAGNEIIYKKYINIGVAVDTDRGLIVPVIRNVDKKNIIELAAELAEISKKARDKKITLEDLQGGNFTISNLGGIGGTGFTPIVNAPEVAILGISRGSYEPKYSGSEFIPRLMLPLSLSYDHRIIDGADGARFLRWICSALEQPILMSLEG
ncbi:MAG: dihydrolipoyllysine-residue acetyltransferase [Ignavibacteria bacterium]|nr:dihydrolipoyllysine-residue acetyltransferase [Ignavibacteria bacterium]